ncbi:hypothetical protein BGX28_007497 [Mortierella sp. GBA30]|nr:hypothetical protein BGX28_007497 [Mortierella sp. GBA30]
MFAKSASLAVVALAATVAAQGGTPTNHMYFTNPVTNDGVYYTGSTETFSWSLPCTAPSVWTSATPNNVTVELIDSTLTTGAFFVANTVSIDCTKPLGNQAWTIPAGDPNKMYSLKVPLVPEPVYSGKFKILSKSAPGPSAAPSAAPQPNKQNAAGALAPALTGAALVASAALMVL